MLQLTGPHGKQYGVGRRNHHSSMFSAETWNNSIGEIHRLFCSGLNSGTKFLRKRSIDKRQNDKRQSLSHKTTQNEEANSYRNDQFENVECNNTDIQVSHLFIVDNPITIYTITKHASSSKRTRPFCFVCIAPRLNPLNSKGPNQRFLEHRQAQIKQNLVVDPRPVFSTIHVFDATIKAVCDYRRA